MDKRGFVISIPQMISGFIAMFVALLGMRVVIPIVQPILDMDWATASVKTGTTIAIYLVIVFVVYIIVYGTVTGKTPNIFSDKKTEGELG